MRFLRAVASAVAAGALLAVLAPAGPVGAAPAPTATVPPFAFPLLEGPQLKVEIGYGAPGGDATSHYGSQPAVANFSVWWWDTGPATQARLELDGVNYAMAEAPVGDGDSTNGTLYVAKVSIASMALGEHTWRFNFTGPSGSTTFPLADALDQVRLDRADRFLTTSIVQLGQQINFSYRASSIPTLREAVNRTMSSIEGQLATHWDANEGYTYADKNHYIIQPSAASSTNHEAFVVGTGASRARFSDSLLFPNNSQPSIKHALLLRGAVLASGLFNESDVEVYTEEMVVNVTTYKHPFLRIALRDGSEQPGDGPVDGDGWMDVDMWGFGLASPVAFGSHFGEDFAAGDDALWDGAVGWPPAADAGTEYVLAPYVRVENATAPDGTLLNFYIWESRVTAQPTVPVFGSNYWIDNPVLFDALSSTQSVGVDLTYSWTIENTVWSAFGPVWTVAIPAVGCYDVTLEVRDVFGDLDSTIPLRFCLRSKTLVAQPMPDVSFPEDGRHMMDLRVYFADADGFGTIQFTFATAPQLQVFVERFPSSSPTFNLTVAPNFCGVTEVTVTATDGASPPVEQRFNVTVTCVNDAPSVTGLPSNFSFSEDGNYTLGPMSLYATDADGDALVWSFNTSSPVRATFDAQSGFLVFSAPPDYWKDTNPGTILVTDGKAFNGSSLVVQVLAANDAPVALPIPPLQLQEDAANATFLLATYFVDPDGENLQAQVTPFPGMLAGYSSLLREVWYKPAANFVGSSSFAVRVWDGSSESVNVTVQVTVAPVNDPPTVVSANPPGYVTAPEGTNLSFRLNATDPDDGTLTYIFSLDGAEVGRSFDGQFVWRTTYQDAGPHTLTVTVADLAGLTTEHSWRMQISNGNRAPTAAITRPAAATFNAGQLIDLAADAEDADGDALTYTWSFGGLRQPMTGENITVKFLSAGNVTVRLAVSDGTATTTVETVLQVVYEKPPDGNGTPPPPPPPNNGTFIPGPEALAAFGAMVAAAAVLVALSRRRR